MRRLTLKSDLFKLTSSVYAKYATPNPRHLRVSFLVTIPETSEFIFPNNNSLASAFDRGCCNPKNNDVFHNDATIACCTSHISGYPIPT